MPLLLRILPRHAVSACWQLLIAHIYIVTTYNIYHGWPGYYIWNALKYSSMTTSAAYVSLRRQRHGPIFICLQGSCIYHIICSMVRYAVWGGLSIKHHYNWIGKEGSWHGPPSHRNPFEKTTQKKTRNAM